MRQLISAAACGLVTVLLVGCGSQNSPPTSSTAKTATATRASDRIELRPTTQGSLLSCAVYADGSNAYVLFQASDVDVQPLCSDWVHSSARQGALWLQGADSPPPVDQNDASVCDLIGYGVTADVADTGNQTVGQSACTSLLADGWNQQ